MRARGEDDGLTAAKREESINRVGAPIVAMSGDFLQERSVVSAADLAAVVPGLNYSVSDTGSGMTAEVRVASAMFSKEIVSQV